MMEMLKLFQDERYYNLYTSLLLCYLIFRPGHTHTHSSAVSFAKISCICVKLLEVRSCGHINYF